MDSSELEIIAQSHLTNYALLASVAFLLYDIVLKLDIEVDFVWKSRWTIAKWLYLITRYWGIVYNVYVGRKSPLFLRLVSVNLAS
ncbi:hypothetical protein D9758_016082 [Tetrapyrgos nigripes]|uniref:DUF6533 domain-containing protein n=1 Tax=Tetrapyrgos nigripes TaxID=182062 RepID=A0A8H5FES1_9AGAR|nr:hypothetical protein D9758_016082 [Tetrapyrgos nigripes]